MPLVAVLSEGLDRNRLPMQYTSVHRAKATLTYDHNQLNILPDDDQQKKITQHSGYNTDFVAGRPVICCQHALVKSAPRGQSVNWTTTLQCWRSTHPEIHVFRS